MSRVPLLHPLDDNKTCLRRHGSGHGAKNAEARVVVPVVQDPFHEVEVDDCVNIAKQVACPELEALSDPQRVQIACCLGQHRRGFHQDAPERRSATESFAQHYTDSTGYITYNAALGERVIGLLGAAPVFTHHELLLAGIGVGVCSSVIPYVCDQLAMARLPRASFALLLSLLPASATLIGIVVLRQIPGVVEVGGIALVVCGVALHHESAAAR